MIERHFIVTGDFTGELHVKFNEYGKLKSIEFTDNNNLTDSQLIWLLSKMPIDADSFGFPTTIKPLVIIEKLRELTFDDFWNAYGRKVDKTKCEKIWNNLKKDKQLLAYKGIKGYEAFLKREGWGRPKKDPATYLNQQTYNDYTN